MTLPLLVRLRAAVMAGLCWLLTLPAAQAQFVINGALDSAYTRYPLALQAAPTLVGDATNTSPLTADGSELDAVYARIASGNLYLFLAGNLESNGTPLELFFDTKAGGQARLLNTNPNVDGNGLNAMAGLRFEPGFEPDYYLTVKIDGGTISASYATLGNTPNTGGLVGSGTASPATLNLPGGSGTLGIDNSNIAGVTASQPSAPSRVGTGIEFMIPLSALGNPAGNFRMSAFINAPGHTSVSNQVLGALPQIRDNLGAPQDVDFSLYPGNQTVLLQTAPNGFGQPMLGLSGAAEVFFSPMPLTPTGYSIDLVLRSLGNFGIGISNIQFSNSVFSTTYSGSVPSGGQRTMTIVYRPTAAGAHAGTLTFNTTDPNQPTVTIRLAGIATASGTIAVDGTQGSDYPTTAALQTTPTGFGDNQSELNGAYARVQNNTLYLLLTGNLEANGNPLELFFDVNPGGQNILANNNPDLDNNGLNRMAGLRFDPAFEPEYYLTIRHQQVGGISVVTGNYATLLGTAGTGRLLTFQARGSAMVLDFTNNEAGQVAINNTNTAGVTATTVGNPGAVTTGIELAIPFAALGFPSADFKVAAFVNGVGHSFLSNQALASLPNGTANLGDPATANFAAQAGNQFFVVPNGGSPSGPDITVSPAPLTFGSVAVGGSGTLTLNINNPGSAPLIISDITSSDATFSVSPTTGTVAPGTSLPVTVTFRPTSAGSWGATLTITSNAPASPTTVTATGTGTAAPAPVLGLSATNLAFGNVNTGSSATRTFRVRNRGNAALIVSNIASSNARFGASPGVGSVAAGDSLLVTVTFAPTATGAQTGTLTINSNGGTSTVTLTGNGVTPAVVTVDGALDAGYGTALAVQTTPTGFGNSTSGSQTVATGGSELDAAYARIDNGTLYLLLTGNLETNGNKLELFFDTSTGGQNQLLNTNPDVDGNGLNRMAGLRFDAGFTPDYYLTLNNTNPAAGFTLAAYFAEVNGAGGTGTTLANGPGRTQPLAFGATTGEVSLDNSNVAGVDGTALGNPAAVTTGVELAIPLAALGNPTGPIRIAAFINGAQHDFVSNQALAGLPNGTPNLGDPFTTDYGAAANAGQQFFTVANGAAVPVVSVTTTSLAFSTQPGVPSTRTFTVRNTGSAPLNITGYTISNGTFTAVPATAAVAPGDSVVVTVTFSSATAGTFTGTLTVRSNDAVTPAPVITLTASVILGLPTELTTAVRLTPNPAADRATLHLPTALLAGGPTTVAIVDALGRTVRTASITASGGPETAVGLDLRDLPRAVYSVRLQTPTGALTRRLAVE